MLDGWCVGYDVVYGFRVDRIFDIYMKCLIVGFFYSVFKCLVNIDMFVNVGDFRFIDCSVVDVLL